MANTNNSNRDVFKDLLGKTEKEAFPGIDSADNIINSLFNGTQSKYKLRILGTNDVNGDIEISEEQRPHTHLIGAPRQGKSKFIEYLIREDIKRGFGVCLLDPTTGGQTVYDVLKYCCSIGYQKVCLIDPYHRYQYQKICGLNPFVYSKKNPNPQSNYKMRAESVVKLMDTLRILFSVNDPATTGRLERYLPPVLNALYNAKVPISYAKYFSKSIYKDQRTDILSHTDKYDDSRLELEEAFGTRMGWDYFQSTITRLQKFFKETLGLMFSAAQGVDFTQMVSEGWVILVNLDTSTGFDTLDSRLLGTLIINEVQSAIDVLGKKNPDAKRKPYYLYLDEAGEYATRKVAQTLALKQKTGLKITIGHQYFGQFEDKFVREAIISTPDLRLMFNLPNSEDRLVISKLFYGGDISPLDANWANSDIPKTQAVIKVGKTKAQRIRIPEVTDPFEKLDNKNIKEKMDQYLEKLFNQPWYYSPKELNEKLNQPLYATNRTPSIDNRFAKPRTKTNLQSDSKISIPDRGIDMDKWKSLSGDLPIGKQHAPKDGKKKTD